MTDIQSAAQQKFAVRLKCKTDKLFLSHMLGYDFQEDVHSDLFANYLQIDQTKNLYDQDEIKSRLVLWPRGHYKTSSAVVEMVQLILNFPDIRILLMSGTLKNTKNLLK